MKEYNKLEMQIKKSWLEVMKNTGKRKILDRNGRNWVIYYP